MKQNPIKDRPDLARCEFRMQNWPPPPATMSLYACQPVFEWIEANVAPHRVNVPGDRLEALRAEGITLSDVLERQYGAPMLRTNTSNEYYWTAGTWMGMMRSTLNPDTHRYDRPRGRAYLFMDANVAFEFKLKYA